ncbi:MAG: hypothetical protein ACYDCC_16420 [Actinomycetota bacterium]
MKESKQEKLGVELTQGMVEEEGMHFHLEVLASGVKDQQSALSRAMDMLEPYLHWERYIDGELVDFYPGEFDWYLVGSRWRGIHTGRVVEPDPTACDACLGTGVKTPPEFLPNGSQVVRLSPAVIAGPGGYSALSSLPPQPRMPREGSGEKICYRCDGAGVAIPWPTCWEPHPLDIARSEDVDSSITATAYLDEEGWHPQIPVKDPRGYEYIQTMWDEPQPVPRRPEDWMVTVDCHY